MKKQIIYPKIFQRVFANTLDFLMIVMITNPIMYVVSKLIFMMTFSDFIYKYNIDLSEYTNMLQFINHPEYHTFFTIGAFLKYLSLVSLVNILLLALYFCLSWYFYGTSVGKAFMRIKIVNYEDHGRISFMNCLKRFIYSIFFFFTIWFIYLDHDRRAFHDKMAGTLVVKM